MTEEHASSEKKQKNIISPAAQLMAKLATKLAIIETVSKISARLAAEQPLVEE